MKLVETSWPSRIEPKNAVAVAWRSVVGFSYLVVINPDVVLTLYQIIQGQRAAFIDGGTQIGLKLNGLLRLSAHYSVKLTDLTWRDILWS